jgi:hypothetical protein
MKRHAAVSTGILLVSLISNVTVFAQQPQPKAIDPTSIAAPTSRVLDRVDSKKPSDAGSLVDATKPHEGALLANPAAPAGPRYVFRFFAFGIFNTRSRHTDTDYVSCGLSVNGTKYPAIVKPMGDLNNGIYTVNLDFPPIAVDPSTKVVYNFAITNAGHGDPAQVQNAVKTGTDQALDESDSDEPWVSIGKAAAALASALFFANCD